MRKGLYIGLAALCCLTGLAGCAKKQNKVEQKVEQKYIQYTIEDFASVYPRWNTLTEEQRNILRKEWNQIKEDNNLMTKKELFELYSNPDEFYKNMSEEERKEFDKIDWHKVVQQASPEQNKKISENPPFIDPYSMTLSDMLLIYNTEKRAAEIAKSRK